MAAKKKAEPTEIKSIKGFDANLQCRGFQFEAGKTYEHEGSVQACASGFHACDASEHPLSVFQFYPPAGSRFFDVVQSGDMHRDGEGAKVASAKITLGVEISLHDLALRAVEFVMSRAKGKDKATNRANNGLASNSGDYGAASNSGYSGAASNSGTRGAASNSGTRGAASNSGYSGAASNSGYSGAASNSGDYGAASNSGTRGAASNSGTRGAASNSGDYGAAFSHATGSRVMCEGDGQALYITEFASDGSIASVACGITGRDGIKAGTWYKAEGGKLVEFY